MEEKIEELKKVILKRIQYKDELPEKIDLIIDKAISTIIGIYKDHYCEYTTIEEYSYEIKNEIGIILNGINAVRNDYQIEEIMNIINRMKNEEGIRKKEQEKNVFLNMKSNDHAYTERIMDTIVDGLESIKLKQKNILETMQYYEKRIFNINQIVQRYIYKFEGFKNDEIYEVLEEDRKELVEFIVNEYDKVFPKTEKQNFKEGLNANITLTNQKEYVKNLNKEEKTENALLNDLLK